MAHITLACAKEDLITRFRVTGKKLPFVFEISEGIGATSSGAFLRLAQEAQRLLIAKGRQEAPVHEHVAPGIAVLLPVVPVGILLIEVAGILGVVGRTAVVNFVPKSPLARSFRATLTVK